MQFFASFPPAHRHERRSYEYTIATKQAVRDATTATSWNDSIASSWQYCYQLTTVDHAGNESEPTPPEQVTGEIPSNLPAQYALHQNVPSPFNPVTRIHYDVPANGERVSLKIYDASGQLIRTLVNEFVSAGRKTLTWDGKDDRGVSVASGVYFCRMRACNYSGIRKMVLLR